MKYLQYLAYGALVCVVLFGVVAPFTSVDYARDIAVVAAPLALWTGRLVVAYRRGVITRRMAMLDGGPVRAGHFWSFNPDVYERRPGFDYFKGYFVKEAGVLLVLWLMLLSVPLMRILDGMGIPVR